MHEAVILAAARTPIGAFGGSLAPVAATALGSTAIRAALARAAIAPDEVDEVLMGCVLAAGLGQAPARQAAMGAGVPDRVGATTINKVCGSGLKAVMLAAQTVRLNEAEIVVAGGMESMSNAPYLLPKARTGYRMGHGEIVDSMIRDGLWDVYTDVHMGSCAEACARKYGLTREDQDAFAVRSYTRALASQKEGRFEDEIVPVDVPGRKGQTVRVADDEEPSRFDESKLRALPPVFEAGGTVTAGNASGINDGAAAVIVASADRARRAGRQPLARIAGAASAARAPEWFTLAPIDAIGRLLTRVGWKSSDVDLFEINEAFASAVLATERELGLDPDRVNVHGGAVALGHPIGASGARILTTLLSALAQRNGRRGVAALCIGGGEAVALAVERL